MRRGLREKGGGGRIKEALRPLLLHSSPALERSQVNREKRTRTDNAILEEHRGFAFLSFTMLRKSCFADGVGVGWGEAMNNSNIFFPSSVLYQVLVTIRGVGRTLRPLARGSTFSAGTLTPSISIVPVTDARKDSLPSISIAERPGMPCFCCLLW